MTIVYYTSTFFLDLSLDVISVLKQHADVHVFIEVTSASRTATVADIKELPDGQYLAKPEQVLTPACYDTLSPYFEGTASTQFVIHKHPSGVSWSTIKASSAVRAQVKNYKPSFVYFEGYTLRTVGLLPYLLRFKKAFLAIHDPVPHTGEGSWKIGLPNLLFFNFPFKKCFIFYSEFAKKLFNDKYPQVKGEREVIRMRPYSYFKHRAKQHDAQREHILFFGRISSYKGIDILLKAIPEVLARFPDERLVIAGKRANDYVIDQALLSKHEQNITVLDRYIDNDELVDLITKAKFVVCPYLDATQSGVLMTAFALNRTVIATQVGSFPEFIIHGRNGLLVPPADHTALAQVIQQALTGDHYRELEANVVLNTAGDTWQKSFQQLLDRYFIPTIGEK